MSVHFLTKADYRCLECKATFIDFEIGQPEFLYGEYLLHNRQAQKIYWYGVGDSAFDELFSIVKALSEVSKQDFNQQLRIFHSILGLCCDWADSDSIYRLKPYCPVCGSIKTNRINFINLWETQEFDLKDVTHNEWNTLTESEKLERVRNALDNPSF